MKTRVKNIIKRIMRMGVIHIVSANFINYVLVFLLNIFIVRLLPKQEFGYYSYAYNIVSLFLIFNGFGISAGILQFCSETEKSRNEHYKFGLKYGVAVNGLLSIFLGIYAFCGELSIPNAREELLFFMVWPLVYFLYDFSNIYLRTQQRNIEYSKALNINSVVKVITAILCTVLLGVKGYILSFYIAALATIGYFYKNNKKNIQEISTVAKLSVDKIKDLMKYSFVCMANNGISQLLYILDVFMIGVLISSASDIALYKVSTQLPNNMYFITSAVMVAIYPAFAQHSTDLQWIRKNTRKVIAVLALINIPIGLAMIFAAEPIIILLYGKAYLSAVPMFRILGIGFVISTLCRMPFGNILCMMRLIKVNFWNSIISGVANIILNYVLIKQFGAIGASYATLSVICISSIVSLICYIYFTREEKIK